jgi:hypothetical protein
VVNGTGTWWVYNRNFKGPNGEGQRFVAGRVSPTIGRFTMTATSCAMPTALFHFNPLTGVFVKLADAPAGSYYRGVALAP